VLREAGAAPSVVDAAPVVDERRFRAMFRHTLSGRPDTRVVVTPEEKRACSRNETPATTYIVANSTNVYSSLVDTKVTGQL
jgi:hypothetical protein